MLYARTQTNNFIKFAWLMHIVPLHAADAAKLLKETTAIRKLLLAHTVKEEN